MPERDWRLRAVANVLYTLLGTTQLLAQQDHVMWVDFEPLAVDRTRVRLTTLVPRGDATPNRQPHWDKNQQITVATLREDFDLAETIQQGARSGANRAHRFGRFEGALDRFNRNIEARIAQDGPPEKAAEDHS
jgi:hypothetical protein